jgi:hypothetical protein
MSRSLLFLGSNTWRTPAIIGGDTQGLDRVLLFSFRVFIEKV